VDKNVMNAIDIAAQAGLIDEDEPIKCRIELVYDMMYDPEENRMPEFSDLREEFYKLIIANADSHNCSFSAFLYETATDERLKKALDDLRLCYQCNGVVENYPQQNFLWRIK
jgi:hypothetical protein